MASERNHSYLSHAPKVSFLTFGKRYYYLAVVLMDKGRAGNKSESKTLFEITTVKRTHVKKIEIAYLTTSFCKTKTQNLSRIYYMKTEVP